MNSHEVCLTFKKEVTLGLVAGDLMSVEDWMGGSCYGNSGNPQQE